MVLTPELRDEIIPFSELALELGVDYGVNKQNKTSAFNIKNLVFVIYDIIATRLSI